MEYKIKVIRSGRKTLSLEISEPGVLTARAPMEMSDKKIQWFINKKQDWILKHMKKAYMNKGKGDDSPKFSQEEINCMAAEALEIFPEVVKYYAEMMGVSYGRITIRHQKTRWGSCSSKGNLNFNCLLMKAPREVLEYVVIHELAHRIEMNHSQNFWAIVEHYEPNYRLYKKWLNDEGRKLIDS